MANPRPFYEAAGNLLVASVAGEVAERLFVPDRRLIVPSDPSLRPHPAYLDWHRQNRFKG